MSYIGEKLSEMLKTKKMSGMTLARKTGISQGQISRWVRGSQVWISKDDLGTIARSLCPAAKDQAELIAAHLRDQADVPQLQAASRSITIHISDKPIRVSEVAVEVPAAFQKTFHTLDLAAVRDHRIADIMNNLAELAE